MFLIKILIKNITYHIIKNIKKEKDFIPKSRVVRTYPLRNTVGKNAHIYQCDTIYTLSPPLNGS